jgi:hypothetical protein
MGGCMFINSPVIANKYNNNDLLIEFIINPQKILQNLRTFKKPSGKYLSPILIYRGKKTKLLSFNDFVFRNLRSFQKFIPMASPSNDIVYSNNFEDSLAMIDLFHKNKSVVYRDQALI